MSDSLTPHGLQLGSLSYTISQSLLKLMSIESVMPSSHLILCRPLLLLPLVFPSIRVFSNESVLCIRWPKYWNFSCSINPSNDYSGLISFRIYRFDLLNSPRDSQELSPAPQFESISSSNEYSGLISFRIDWLDLLAVQGSLKNLLQYHSSKASILWLRTYG